jgi:hypothetical protein
MNARTFFSFVILSITMVGCSSMPQGMRIRAVSPSIDEAYRKLSLALTMDGFEIEMADPERLPAGQAGFTAETKWRPLKVDEKSKEDVAFNGAQIETKIAIRLERRGQLYDVFVTPTLRYENKGNIEVRVADGKHPLWEKWRRVVRTLVQVETKEED